MNKISQLADRTRKKNMSENRLSPNQFIIDGDTCSIGLRDNQGQIRAWAVIDAEDYDRCKEFKWGLQDAKTGIYVSSQVRREDGRWKKVKLHQFIAGKGVDHIDRNGLNNRKSNLRPATKNDNARNKGMQRNNESGYKGVSRCGPKWRACIAIDGKNKHLGLFDSPEAAAIRYNQASRELHGMFGYMNVIG